MRLLKRIYVLYIFIFLSNFRPINPYLYKFFIIEKNVTREQALHTLLPIVTYSYMCHLVLMFVFSGLYFLKSLLIISSLTALISTCIRIWCSSLQELVFSEIIRGVSEATGLGYYIYIYHYYDALNFQRVTTYVRICALLAQIVSVNLAQYLFKLNFLNLEKIEYIHLTASSVATILIFFLPSAKENLYPISTPINTYKSVSNRIQEQISVLKVKFVDSFNQKCIIRWSIWFILSNWSFNQISVFIQPLWENLHRGSYNGLVEGFLGIFSLIMVLIAGFSNIDWKKRTTIVMPLLLGIQFILLMSGITFSDGFILFNYISYIIFGGIYYFTITVVSAEIAKTHQKNCFPLVFSFLYMVASMLNTIVVVTVNDDVGGYKIPSRQQFFIYFIIFVVIYVIICLTYEVKKRIDTLMTKH